MIRSRGRVFLDAKQRNFYVSGKAVLMEAVVCRSGLTHAGFLSVRAVALFIVEPVTAGIDLEMS